MTWGLVSYSERASWVPVQVQDRAGHVRLMVTDPALLSILTLWTGQIGFRQKAPKMSGRPLLPLYVVSFPVIIADLTL